MENNPFQGSNFIGRDLLNMVRILTLRAFKNTNGKKR
jgi:hypothetical protein